ncbi:MAG: ankyrin repeat domain-containing protein [Akkermansia muciniphila]|nr:ankyrin repeat domain-containing protein [Akkermansia muciniphila]
MNELLSELLKASRAAVLCVAAALPATAVPDAAGLMAALATNDDVQRLERAVEDAKTGKMMMTSMTADRKAQRDATKELKKLERDLAKCKRQLKQRNEAIARLAKEVEKSGNINRRDKQGRTLAMLVAECNCTAAMEKVLADDPKLDLRDKAGQTALGYEQSVMGYALAAHLQKRWAQAIENADEDAVTYLLECGLPPDTLVEGEPPLGYAIKSGKKEVVDVLLATRPSVKTRMSDGTTMLEQAVLHNMSGAIRYLVGGGCNVNDPLSSGEHPFFRLVTRGNAEAVRTWLEVVPGMDAQKLPSTNPACVAARCGTPETLAAVLDSRANLLDTPDDFGHTPLQEAARRGSVEMIADLLKRGAKPDAVSKQGETPLMCAALSGNAAAVRALLQAAPETRDAKDAEGKTAARYAEQSGSAAAVQALSAGNEQ